MRASARRFAQKKLWLWLLGALGGSGLAYVLVFGLAAAVLGASFAGCEPGSEPALAASSGPTPSAYALASIPPERLRLYEQAGTRFDIDWSFLASIGAQECGNGDCAGTNSSGCAGPMQIAYVRGSPCSPGPGPTLWERFAVSAHPGQPPSIERSGGRDRHRREDSPPGHGRAGDRRQLRRIPRSRLPLLRRLRRLIGELRGRGDGPRRPVRVHRHRLPQRRRARRWRNRYRAAVAAPASSPPKRPAARRSSRSLKARSARANTPKAPTARSTGPARNGARCSPRGSGNTRACPSPAPRPRMDTPGRCTPGPKNTAAESFRRRRRQRRATRSSTAPGRATARTSGSSPRSFRTGRSSRSRATTPGTLRASARSPRPTRSVRPRRCMGMRSRPRPTRRRREGRDGTVTQDDGRQYGQPRERAQSSRGRSSTCSPALAAGRRPCGCSA